MWLHYLTALLNLVVVADMPTGPSFGVRKALDQAEGGQQLVGFVHITTQPIERFASAASYEDAVFLMLRRKPCCEMAQHQVGCDLCRGQGVYPSFEEEVDRKTDQLGRSSAAGYRVCDRIADARFVADHESLEATVAAGLPGHGHETRG